MGRIKTRPLKAITEKVFNEREEAFTVDFSANKKIVSESLDVKSKKLRNIIAGYSTRLKKRQTRNWVGDNYGRREFYIHWAEAFYELRD